MKATLNSTIVLLALLAAVLCSTAFYAQSRQTALITEVGKIDNSLKGIEQYLSAGARITFKCPDNNASLFSMCRYVLAPRYLSFKEAQEYDTSLIIARLQAGENELNTITTNRRVIWQHSDSAYHYYLTVRS